jgi:prevent-host-death family protein
LKKQNDYNDYPGHQQLECGSMGSSTWTVADAKAKLSEVIQLAQSRGPQTITRNGRTAAVVISAEEWERKTKRSGNLAEFFAGSPLRGSRLDAKRLKTGPRRGNV